MINLWSFASSVIESSVICSLTASIDPTPLLLVGSVVIAITVFITYRSMPRAKL